MDAVRRALHRGELLVAVLVRLRLLALRGHEPVKRRRVRGRGRWAVPNLVLHLERGGVVERT